MAKPLLEEEEKRAVLEVLESGMLAQGQKVAEFEQKFAEFIGVKHAIATSSGTTALHTALLAHTITESDEVITSPFSFIATANAIKMAGAIPVFVDIEKKTFNLNPDLIESAITPKTRAIMPVHLFGQSCDMDRIMAIAQRYNLIIIEDACQAHGAEFQGKKAGSFDTGCFSFYATKNMTTGEGGMITTNDDAVAAKARKIINHGSEKKYYHDVLGYNYRMTDLAAAIGLEQLKKLSYFNRKRKEHAQYLHQQLKNKKGIIVPDITAGHVFHQFTIRITPEFGKSRDESQQILLQNEIQSSIFYPLPIHQQKVYPNHQQTFPVAEKAAQEVLSLPVHPALTPNELNLIVEAIQQLESSFQNKFLLRNQLRKRRDAITPEETATKNQQIANALSSFAAFQQESTILFYYPVKNEVDTRPIIRKALALKKRVLLPAANKEKISLTLYLINDEKNDLEMGAYGILKPKKSCPVIDKSEVDLIIVPGIGFDERGNRLGSGKGFYDYFLKSSTAKKIGLAYESQIVNNLPTEEHDVPIDIIITEKRIIRCR